MTELSQEEVLEIAKECGMNDNILTCSECGKPLTRLLAARPQSDQYTTCDSCFSNAFFAAKRAAAIAYLRSKNIYRGDVNNSHQFFIGK